MRTARKRYDPFGAVSITAALLVFVYAISQAPLLPLRLFRFRSVAGSNAVGFLLGASFLTSVFVGTLDMQQVLGFSALTTGAAWTTASVTSLVFANLSQKIVTRTSPKAVMAAGVTLIGRVGSPTRLRRPSGLADDGPKSAVSRTARGGTR